MSIKTSANHLAGWDPSEVVGTVDNLGCPMLAKIGEAFAYAHLATRKGPKSLGKGSRTIQGKDGAHADLLWQSSSHTLVIAFEGPEGTRDAASTKGTMYEARRPPPYLVNIAPEAQVHSGFLDILQGFLDATSGAKGMGDVVREMSGNNPPRRILMTGWSIGGALATIAAPWAALQCPTADVRCITFGAPLSANAAFAEVFRWLVGMSYRLVYNKDPVPASGGGMLGAFVPVKGSTYVTEKAEYSPGPVGGWTREERDHDLVKYGNAIRTAIGHQIEVEVNDPECRADPDGVRLAIRESTLDDWAQATGDEAVVKIKDFFREGFPEPRSHFWGVEDEVGPDQEEGIGKAAKEACQDPGPLPVVEDQEEAGSTMARAGSAYRKVVEEAPGGINTGLAVGDGAPAFMARAFSLAEREDALFDLRHLTTLEKVLVLGKVSQAVVVAGAAYYDEHAFTKITGITNVKMVHDTGKTDVQVNVGWLDYCGTGTVVLAFRGTVTAQDGFQDAKFLRRGIDYLRHIYPGAKAHMGFLQQFEAVVDPNVPERNIGAVVRQLSRGKMPNRVLCTGHSLGGAVATLGATWASLEYPNADVRCITFGSPRVGNRKFRAAFHAMVGCSLRVVYGADPVPLMPPNTSLWLRYFHVDAAIHVHRNAVMLRTRPWHYAFRPNVADHWVVRYASGLYGILPGGTDLMPRFEYEQMRTGSRRRRRFDDDGAAAEAPVGCFGRRETATTDPDGGTRVKPCLEGQVEDSKPAEPNHPADPLRPVLHMLSRLKQWT